jgi:hypothetical protein
MRSAKHVDNLIVSEMLPDDGARAAASRIISRLIDKGTFLCNYRGTSHPMVGISIKHFCCLS